MIEVLANENVETLREYERALVAAVHAITTMEAPDRAAYMEEFSTLKGMLAAIRYQAASKEAKARRAERKCEELYSAAADAARAMGEP